MCSLGARTREVKAMYLNEMRRKRIHCQSECKSKSEYAHIMVGGNSSSVNLHCLSGGQLVIPVGFGTSGVSEVCTGRPPEGPRETATMLRITVDAANATRPSEMLRALITAPL